MGIAHLPPVVIARLMQRSWQACRRRLALPAGERDGSARLA